MALGALTTIALAVGAARTADTAPVAERARLRDHFTAEDISRAARYRGTRYAIEFAALAATVAALAIAAAGTRRLGPWAGGLSGDRRWLQALLVVGAVSVGLALIQLPFDLARFFHDRSFGLVTQRVSGLLVDIGKGLGFQGAVSAAAAVGFFALARALPRGWPLAAAAAAAALTVLLTFAWPLLYEPLFNRFTPVDAGTRARVLEIAGRAGVRVSDVLEVDASRRTTRLNAYVSGFGATKRVVLFDTLLARASPPEVDLVVAHELAHEAHHDVLRGTAVGAGGAMLAVLVIWGLTGPAVASRVGFAGPSDPAAVPFLALLLAVSGILALPAENALSRRMEASADRAAIDYTHDPETAIAVEVRLARENVSDLDPNRFVRWALFSHPPALERIDIALRWRAAHPSAHPIGAPARVP